jgi:hypothetical protein
VIFNRLRRPCNRRSMRGLSIQVHASVTPLRPPADVPAVATAFFVVKFIRSKDLFVIRPSLKVRSVMLPYKWLLSKKKKKNSHPSRTQLACFGKPHDLILSACYSNYQRRTGDSRLRHRFLRFPLLSGGLVGAGEGGEAG